MDLISGLDQKRIGVAPFDNLEDITPLMTFNLEPTTIDVSDDFLVAGSRFVSCVKSIIFLQ